MTKPSPRKHGHRKDLPRNHWLVRLRMVTSVDDLRSLRFWKAAAAEFTGTMLLVIVGCGSCISWDQHGKTVQIALCFGLTVATIVWNIAHISGGHINPAVTAAFFVTRKISFARALVYIVAQCVGSIIGAGLLKGMTPVARRGSLGVTLPSEEMDNGRAFAVEFFVTFILVFTVFATCDKKRTDLGGSFPLAIGLSVTTCHLFAIPFTGSSMNSARSFGPVVITGIWQQHWIYWIGPLLGGSVAGLIYDTGFAANASLEKARAFLLASDYDNDQYPAKRRKVRILREGDSLEDGRVISPQGNDTKELVPHDKENARLSITTE